MTHQKLSRETLSRQLEDALRADIVLGLYKPGERLLTQEMERRYEVSATPLREAFQRLAASGLLSVEPGHGARVAPASLDDLRDIYQARLIIELETLSLSLEHGDEAWADQIKRDMAVLRRASRALAEGATREALLAWAAAHKDFHQSLLAACPSRWMLRFATLLAEHSERYRMLSVWGGTTTRDTLSEHETIFELAIARDHAGVREAMREHLLRTVHSLEQHLAGTPPAPSSQT